MPNIRINDVPQRIQYVATNGQTQFNIPFPFMANTDITAWNDAAQMQLTVDYTLVGADTSSGGQLTLVVPATGGEIITIMGAMPVDRTSIYSPVVSDLTATDLNNDFNSDVIMIKQLETLQKFLQLMYKPYSEVSQDPDVTVDRWIPILPPNHTWKKNAGDTEIIPTLIPDNPVGSVGGNFQNDQRLVRTNIDGGANDIEETNITAPDLNTLSTATGDLNLDAADNLLLKGQQWPALIGGNGTVLGVVGGILAYLNVPTAPTPTTVDVIPKFSNTTGSLADSQFYEDGTDLMLPADPTQDMAAATKQYVDSHTSGVQSVGSGTGIDVDNTNPAAPVVSLDTTVVSILNYSVQQDGSPIYGVDSQATDAYVITLTPVPLAYVDGMTIRFKANTQNTGDATLNVNGLGAIPILKFHDQVLATGDIEAGQIVTVAYDATANVWQMQSQTAATPGGGTVTSVGVTSSTLIVTGSPVTNSGDINIELPSAQYPVQVVNTTLTSVATTTSTIPTDDTIPQSGEGLEIMTLSITPTNVDNILMIEVVVNMAGVNMSLVAALFQDSTANALAAAVATTENASAAFQQVTFNYYMVAGTTSATTFKVRVGPNNTDTVTINGILSARRFGGVMATSITVTEYKA